MRLFSTCLLAALGGVVLTTSLSCEREPRPLFDSNFQSQAEVTLFNATHDVLPIRFQALRRQYAVDCDLVAQDPARYLREDHLSNPNRRFVLSGTEVAIETPDDDLNRPCRIAFLDLDDDRLTTVAAIWPRELPVKTFYTDVDAPSSVPPEDATLIAEADYSGANPAEVPEWRARPCNGQIANCSEDEYDDALRIPSGADYHWSVMGEELTYQQWESSSIADTPVEDPLDESCPTGRNRTPLSWTSTSSGRWEVISVLEREGGCFDVELATEMGSTNNWSFCGSRRLSTRLDPESVRGTVVVEFFRENQFGNPPAAYENLTIDIRRETEEGELFQIETIELVRGQSIPDHMGLNWEAEPTTSCDARQEIEECLQMVIPTSLRLTTSTGQFEAVPGDIIGLDPSAERRLEYIRGMHRAVFDVNCNDERLGPHQINHPGTYMELIYYAGVTVVGG